MAIIFSLSEMYGLARSGKNQLSRGAVKMDNKLRGYSEVIKKERGNIAYYYFGKRIALLDPINHILLIDDCDSDNPRSKLSNRAVLIRLNKINPCVNIFWENYRLKYRDYCDPDLHDGDSLRWNGKMKIKVPHKYRH